jgi:hypothetical protein
MSGYEQPRTQGGQNVVHAKQLYQEWACEECVDRVKRGLDPGQGTLM